MSQSPPPHASVPPAEPVREPRPPFPAQHQSPPGTEEDLSPSPRWRGERYRPAAKLRDMVALVTGGDSGIGRSVAYHFAREGADVAITALPEEMEDARRTEAAISACGQECLVLTGDLGDASYCREVVNRTHDRFGRLDVLVHNAAWQNRAPIEDLSDEELDTTLTVNIAAYLRLARAARPLMQPGGSIIATGSIVGLQGAPELAHYGASKGAIHAITRCLARELLEAGIRVNCVAPGPVWTPLNVADTGVDAEDVASFGEGLASIPMQRPAQPEELAPAYVYFASNADSSYVTGAVLPVTGTPA